MVGAKIHTRRVAVFIPGCGAALGAFLLGLGNGNDTFATTPARIDEAGEIAGRCNIQSNSSPAHDVFVPISRGDVGVYAVRVSFRPRVVERTATGCAAYAIKLTDSMNELI